MMFPFTNNYKTGKERVSKVAPYTCLLYTSCVRSRNHFSISHQREQWNPYPKIIQKKRQ